jgi:hypothetical protein
VIAVWVSKGRRKTTIAISWMHSAATVLALFNKRPLPEVGKLGRALRRDARVERRRCYDAAT